MREAQIAEAVGAGVARIADIVSRLYADVPRLLHGMAALTVRAHLDKLLAEGVVVEDAGERFSLRS